MSGRNGEHHPRLPPALNYPGTDLGREGGREGGRKEGRKERRKEGRKEGREGGREGKREGREKRIRGERRGVRVREGGRESREGGRKESREGEGIRENDRNGKHSWQVWQYLTFHVDPGKEGGSTANLSTTALERRGEGERGQSVAGHRKDLLQNFLPSGAGNHS